MSLLQLIPLKTYFLYAKLAAGGFLCLGVASFVLAFFHYRHEAKQQKEQIEKLVSDNKQLQVEISDTKIALQETQQLKEKVQIVTNTVTKYVVDKNQKVKEDFSHATTDPERSAIATDELSKRVACMDKILNDNGTDIPKECEVSK